MIAASIRRFFAALPLAAGLLLCASSPVAQTAAQSPDPAMMFTDEELSVGKVAGKWNMGFNLDWEQKRTPSVPVAVVAMTSVSGQGRYLGLVKMAKVTLSNRGAAAVNSVSLRWTLTRPDDPKTILLEGVTPTFDAEVPPGRKLKTDIPHILVNRIVTPILKDGELSGAYQLTVGVEEIIFADGSAWRRADAPRR